MAALPQPQSATVDTIYRWRERTTESGHRAHLGASVLGHPCDRHLWLLWRWAESERFDGRLLRLFDTGKREEPRVIEELRGIGCQVWADDGTGQYRVSAVSGHAGGSVDGVVQGLPEAPKTPHVLEIKTHNAKSFADLTKKGVRESKPTHWTQMQAYMHLMQIDRALYFAVCKDNDQIYTERVPYDAPEAVKIMARAERVVRADEPPLRISDDPAWHECRFCRFHPICHGTTVPEVNCRTCAHSTAELDGDGRWSCARHGADLPIDTQRAGCADHRYIPVLLERIGKPIDSVGESIVYAADDGAVFSNGDYPGFGSAEIRAAADKRFLVDPEVVKLRAAHPTARVVG